MFIFVIEIKLCVKYFILVQRPCHHFLLVIYAYYHSLVDMKLLLQTAVELFTMGPEQVYPQNLGRNIILYYVIIMHTMSCPLIFAIADVLRHLYDAEDSISTVQTLQDCGSSVPFMSQCGQLQDPSSCNAYQVF